MPSMAAPQLPTPMRSPLPLGRGARAWPAWGLLLALWLMAPAVAWVVHQQWGWSLAAASAPWMAWALLGSPVVEEAIFRLGLQAQLERWLSTAPHPWLGRHAAACACALASMAFASVHAPQHGWASVAWLAPGLALGAVWVTHRRWMPCVLTHAWFNLCLWLVSQSSQAL